MQPLSVLAYAAANAWEVLARVESVDSTRIGIMGHSYGAKWAMFASCLYEKFACTAWSDPGIVFDETKDNYINYKPAILSALRPRYDEANKQWKVEVQNFGLSASEETTLKITSNGLTVAETLLPKLKPYETKTVSIKGENRLEDQRLVSVKFYRNGNETAVNKF